MKTITTMTFVLVVLCSPFAVLAAPVYRVLQLGFNDFEHTNSNGDKMSSAFQLNEKGKVIGSSGRYNGGSVYLGESAWLSNGTSTIKLGLVGIEHTRIDGYKYSVAYRLNEAGQVTGSSYRFRRSTELGESAWFYNGTATIEIGLVDSDHTSSIGARFSSPFFLNEAGHVSGQSARYARDNFGLGSGGSAWLYNGATTINIGLVDEEHTSYFGSKQSVVMGMNESGQVMGRSVRFNGGTDDLGLSAWFYDGTATIKIGHTGAAYTSYDGYKESIPYGLNDAGQVIGYSTRYNGRNFPAPISSIAWLYDGTTTIDIGLTGPEHTASDGSSGSVPFALNEAGQVIGESWRYVGGTTLLGVGHSAWLFNGTSTLDIGLTGNEHTNNNGYKHSSVSKINEAGQVIGYSKRYNRGSIDLGQSAWLYDGATTLDIGLTGPEYTAGDGYNFSQAFALNEAGQVIGVSSRQNTLSDQRQQDAWVYDRTLNHTFALRLSTRSDGYAYSTADYLGEDGMVLGTYTLFDKFGGNLGYRAFYFTIADGLHDLGSLVDGGLDAHGWDYLAWTIRANGLRQILGHGKLASQSAGQYAYLLTLIPEPSTLLLAAIAIPSLMMSWRRLSLFRAQACTASRA